MLLGVCPAGLSIVPGLVSNRALRGKVEFGWPLSQGWKEEKEEEAQNVVTLVGVCLFTVFFALDLSVLALPYWVETFIGRAAKKPFESPWGSRFHGLSWVLESPTFFTGLPLYPKTGGLTPHAPFGPMAPSFALACLGNLAMTSMMHACLLDLSPKVVTGCGVSM